MRKKKSLVVKKVKSQKVNNQPNQKKNNLNPKIKRMKK
ncbi:hypothetical protein CGSHiR3021_05052 [Haemophilus influenzae 22.4-21]|uniref:Uncharacterized protein n=1 Tax=Haemophilus influenzae 22.4-21 TaxID=375063 RepID=A4NYB4_HAEIF|nr:hypothetical protein CGSHiR3021_05052 [Haemophilus influenzae 22.4-21]